MKKPYEKPVIHKLQSTMMNKYGSSPYFYRRVRQEIDGISIDDLVSKYGSPLFVYSEKKLRSRYRIFYKAISTRYPNVVFGWSYKTNYLKSICSVLHSEGAIAEVVSEFEYQKARKLGVKGSDIIYNGPHKSMKSLEQAADEGAMINIDHFEEIADLEEVSDKLGKKIKAGIRVNMDTGIHPQWSRFGFNIESGQALDAVKRIQNGGKIILNGLHCHIGTYIVEPMAYAREIEKMIALANEIEEKYSFSIEYLDIGGGFPSVNKLKGSYLPPEISVPSIEEYAEKISGALYKNLRPGSFPKLILESGRAIVDEAGYMITTIFASKRLPDGRKAYIADGGLNLLFTSFWYKFGIEIDRELNGPNEPSVIYGPLCMNIDVIDEGSLLPPVPRGTRLIFSPVGAYNNTQWMQFIEYRPNIVMIGSKGELDCIRKSEDLDYIESLESIPDRFKK